METFIVLDLRNSTALQKHFEGFLLIKEELPVLFSVTERKPIFILYISIFVMP